MHEDKEWDEIIKPKKHLFDLNLKELFSHKDLIILLVKRDFIALYKQTILGPLWYFIQPLLTTLMFMFVFNRVADISTGTIPPILFYLSGLLPWNYFAQNVTNTSNTFINNAHIFGKVYFPRLTVPVSIVISGLISFSIQFILFIIIYIIYFFQIQLHLTFQLFFIPILLLITACLSLGFGILISALTTKYKDLRFLIQFGIQLLMYATPVIYPINNISKNYQFFIMLNPMTPVIEAFRFCFFGEGVFQWLFILYSAIFSIFVLVLGIVTFNKVERTFMDTV